MIAEKLDYTIAKGRLYRLGGTIALDGRVSWAPKMDGRFQPLNCYLLIEPDRCVLIDTGIAAHRDLVIEQLKRVLPPNLPLTVFATRTEFECAGNLRAIHGMVGIDEMLAGGGANPFDAYDEVARGVQMTMKRHKLSHTADRPLPLGSSTSVVMFPPRIRVLTTYWLYDSVTRTMFTSDFFGHTSIASANASPFLRSGDPDPTTYEILKAHVLAKFFWLARAQTEALAVWLEDIFREFDVEVIAPTHGCVLVGKDLIQKHHKMLVRLLRDVGQDQPKAVVTGESVHA